MSRYDHLEREVDMLLAKLREQEQQVKAPKVDLGLVTAATYYECLVKRAGIDVQAIRATLETECGDDKNAFWQRLRDELQQLKHVWEPVRERDKAEAAARLQAMRAQRPKQYVEPYAGPMPQKAQSPRAAMPAKSDKLEVAVPPGQARAAVTRARAGPTAYPNDRDRQWVQEGEAARRRRTFDPYHSFPFDKE